MLKKSSSNLTDPIQCGSTLNQIIDAPLPLVWSLVRQFHNPQAYKGFVRNCNMLEGSGAEKGSVRELVLISGLPSERSMERLDRLDDDSCVMEVSVIGGDHMLVNYKSTIALHEMTREEGGSGCKTVVIESYVVDIPDGSCEEDTCCFADTIIGCNLKSLARVTEKMVRESQIF
ncbi:hypothetical protein Tsubulata_014735 [Turnera subulata]|uniref:Uncharacterized protein n=1 Tax=Turnera subulata TaxID=218843 RepID=A0A9Q0JST5_9ROSI|nr:hypothetical protein Tsubulata_014735 [Turnera subulata]